MQQRKIKTPDCTDSLKIALCTPQYIHLTLIDTNSAMNEYVEHQLSEEKVSILEKRLKKALKVFFGELVGDH